MNTIMHGLGLNMINMHFNLYNNAWYRFQDDKMNLDEYNNTWFWYEKDTIKFISI